MKVLCTTCADYVTILVPDKPMPLVGKPSVGVGSIVLCGACAKKLKPKDTK